MRRRPTAPRGRERERERKYNQFTNKLSRDHPNVRARSGYIQVPPAFAFHFRPPSQHPMFPYPPPLCSMLRLGFGISHGSAASLCATLRSGVASLCPTLRSYEASLCATLLGGAASLCATLRGGTASLCAMLRGGVASLGAALSLGRRGTIPAVSYDGSIVPLPCAARCKCMKPLSSRDEGAVPLSHNGGAAPSSVLCGSARVQVLYARGAEVVVVVAVAVGAVAGVARSAGRGLWRASSCGSSCGVESSLAPRAES